MTLVNDSAHKSIHFTQVNVKNMPCNSLGFVAKLIKICRELAHSSRVTPTRNRGSAPGMNLYLVLYCTYCLLSF